jgi:hypothetical protein
MVVSWILPLRNVFFLVLGVPYDDWWANAFESFIACHLPPGVGDIWWVLVDWVKVLELSRPGHQL